MVKCSHQHGGHDIPSAVRLPDHRWRHDLALGLEVQVAKSAHPSAATRHRACHDLGPVTPIRIVWGLLGLTEVISLATVDPIRDEDGWRFTLDLGGRDPVLGIKYLREAPPTHLRVHSEGESAPGDALLRDDHRSDAIRPTSMTARRATFGRPRLASRHARMS